MVVSHKKSYFNLSLFHNNCNVYFHCKWILLVQLLNALNVLNVWELFSKCSLTPTKRGNSNIEEERNGAKWSHNYLAICIVCDKVTNANDWQGSYRVHESHWKTITRTQSNQIVSNQRFIISGKWISVVSPILYYSKCRRTANDSLSFSFYVHMNINQTLTQDHQWDSSVICMTLKWKLCRKRLERKRKKVHEQWSAPSISISFNICLFIRFVSFRFVFFFLVNPISLFIHNSKCVQCTVYILFVFLCIFCIAFPDRTQSTQSIDINVYHQI